MEEREGRRMKGEGQGEERGRERESDKIPHAECSVGGYKLSRGGLECEFCKYSLCGLHWSNGRHAWDT